MLFRLRRQAAAPAAEPREPAVVESPQPAPETKPTLALAPVPPPPPPVPTIVTEGPAQLEAGGILTIDCTAIIHNWRTLANQAAPADCAAVVKADAYGCGLDHVVTALSSAGCKTFFVAQLSEARSVRAIAPDATIYVLNGVLPGTSPGFAAINAQPVIGNLLELAEWDAFCSAHQWRGGAALHFDTGMNRLGMSLEEAAALSVRTRTANHGITLVMSHHACADEPDHPLNALQTRIFREIRGLYRGIPASLANSSGIYLGPQTHFDMVRPGIALYGGNPTPGSDNPMRPVVELKAHVVQIRTVANGASVGYGATWTAKRDSRIAIVGVGYADGYPRPVSSSDVHRGGDAALAGRRCPVVGRVSMDLLAIDITDLPADAVRRGDLATLIGGDLGIDELAKWGRTINYDVLTRLGQRFHRVWKS